MSQLIQPIEDISEVEEFLEAAEANEPMQLSKQEEGKVDKSEAKI